MGRVARRASRTACWPKAFAATEYRWQQGTLAAGSTTITTKKRYARWQEALPELGLTCPIEVAHGEAAGAPP